MPSRRTDLDHQPQSRSVEQPDSANPTEIVYHRVPALSPEMLDAERAELQRKEEEKMKAEVKKVLKNNQKKSTGTSLMPIKGISTAMKNQLAMLSIYDFSSLLVSGQYISGRQNIADRLSIDYREVDSWLKQADLWRLPGMTTDLAYLLVLAGVRCVEDLAEADYNKALPILRSIEKTHPDFTPFKDHELDQAIIQAIELVKKNAEYTGREYPYCLEIPLDDPDPSYLKRDDLRDQNANRFSSEDSLSAIRKGLENLSSLGLENYWPLPSKISGQVVCKKGDGFEAAPDQLVEITGFLTANPDGSAHALVPSAYTDDQGRFELTMPDAYCFKEVVTFTVRTRDKSYTFNKNASEIIDLTSARHQNDVDVIDNTVELESPLIIDDAHIQTEVPARALPSVALMGEGDKTVRLSSDTAPSRIYQYKVLSRLVEPKLSKGKDSQNAERQGITEAINVDGFRDQLHESPMDLYKMSSLGIGYVLNMHQAWVPDGFALGSLLYSLILAPGEEQKIIIRERGESYDVGDEASSADITSESYEAYQTDDEDAAYDYALNQLSQGESSFYATSKTSNAGASGGLGGLLNGISFGLSVGGAWSKTSSSGNTSASQRNTHNETSTCAQSFQHAIKSASERIAQTKRVSIRVASGEEAEGVTSKIVANHNHSHVMTVQYWEVMRRYKIETAVDGVDMVLFVPLELLEFLPKEASGSKSNYNLTTDEMCQFNRDMLNRRYNMLLKHYDVLYSALPRKYKFGLERIRYYSELPMWKMEPVFQESRESFTVAVLGNILFYDRVTVKICLKNGKGFIEGVQASTVKERLGTALAIEKCKTRKDLKNTIRDLKNDAHAVVYFDFTLPDNCTVYDLSYLILENHPSPQTGTLCNYLNTEAENLAIANYEGKMKDLYKDNDYSKGDIEKINRFRQGLPENYTDPNWSLSERELSALGDTRFEISFFKPKQEDGKNYSPDIHLDSSSGTLRSQVTINLSVHSACLRYNELLKMEETFHHILGNVVRYSQAVWSSLSAHERAIMLEPYTIDISDGDDTKIPLLNCVNVMAPLGFYGNCMLFPFTMPEELSQEMGNSMRDGYKTEKDWQDALYNYHTNCFRVPTTVISLPTNGMVGEAILGETNVSELIDLTRFWNWKDSEIRHADAIDNTAFKETELLDGRTPAAFVETAKGATAPESVSVPDLLKALTSKTTPEFNDISGQQLLSKLIQSVTDSATTGRDQIVQSNTDFITSALKGLIDLDKAKTEARAAAEKEAKAEADKAAAEKKAAEQKAQGEGGGGKGGGGEGGGGKGGGGEGGGGKGDGSEGGGGKSQGGSGDGKVDTSKNDTSKNDVSKNQDKTIVKNESVKTDSGKNDPGKTDTGKTDTGKTDTGKTDTGKTDTGKTDTGKTQVNTESDQSNTTTSTDTGTDTAVSSSNVDNILMKVLSQNMDADSVKYRNLIMQRLATEADVKPSRIPEPGNITEIGGYYNQLMKLRETGMMKQMLASVLGLPIN